MKGCRLMSLLAGVMLHPACSSTGFFTCTDSNQCSSDDGLGSCEPTGFCSFPDPSCEAGQRYGDLAGPLSNTCVNPTTASTSESSTSSSTDPVPTGDGDTTAAATGVESTETSSSNGTTSPISGSGSGSGSDTEVVASTGVAESSSTGSPVDDGLIGWWPLDDSPDDGVLDASLNGNDGTCLGDCPTPNPEGFYTFDGTQVVIFPGGDLGAPMFTVALWVRPSAATTEIDPVVFTKPAGDFVWNSWGLHYDNVLTDFEFVIGNPEENTATVLDKPPLAGWHHYVGRFDGATATLFQDGVPTTSTAIPEGYFVIDDNDVYLGGDFDEGGPAEPRYTGDVDDVRYYDRPLTDLEIEALAAAPR